MQPDHLWDVLKYRFGRIQWCCWSLPCSSGSRSLQPCWGLSELIREVVPVLQSADLGASGGGSGFWGGGLGSEFSTCSSHKVVVILSVPGSPWDKDLIAFCVFTPHVPNNVPATDFVLSNFFFNSDLNKQLLKLVKFIHLHLPVCLKKPIWVLSRASWFQKSALAVLRWNRRETRRGSHAGSAWLRGRPVFNERGLRAPAPLLADFAKAFRLGANLPPD